VIVSDLAARGLDIKGLTHVFNLDVPAQSKDYLDIFVHDRQTGQTTGQTTRVSVASDGTQGDDSSALPSITSDGRYVAFASGNSNLVDDDTNGQWDSFVHDRQTDISYPARRNEAG
jgi:Tol biopolymer transport system component